MRIDSARGGARVASAAPASKATGASPSSDEKGATGDVIDQGTQAQNDVAQQFAQAQQTQLREQVELMTARQQFDFQTDERAELMREADAIQALTLAQIKSDDEYTQKWIALI